MEERKIAVLGCCGEDEEISREIGILNDPELGRVLALPVKPSKEEVKEE